LPLYSGPERDRFFRWGLAQMVCNET
jgi:hypothetical protein